MVQQKRKDIIQVTVCSNKTNKVSAVRVTRVE